MREVLYTITYNRPLTADVWEMRLAGNTGAITAPGQFINLRLEGLFLRRPISVYHWDQESLTIIYKVVGRGTEALAAMGPGQKLDALCGLGNGFDVSKCGRRTLLIGGGVGVPPLYGLARALLAAGKKAGGAAGLQHQKRGILREGLRRPGGGDHRDHRGRQLWAKGVRHRRPAGGVRLLLRLRSSAHAPGGVRRDGHLRPPQL